MKKEKAVKSVSVDNVYRLDGRVPLGKAIPFGLQHILAMFVSNLTPLLLVASVAYVNGKTGYFEENPHELAQLLQCAMLAAGIGTLVQLYPLWKIGSRLPVVMGCGFTFLVSLKTVASNPEWGYEGMLGAIIVGGLFEGVLGLTLKYWRHLIAPIVSACVVTAIGMTLFSVGMGSYGGNSSASDFGAWYHIVVATVTLITCLIWKYKASSVWKNLNVLVGLAVGYILSVIFTVTGVAEMVNFAKMTSTIEELGFINIPMPVFLNHTPTFHIGAIITIGIMFIVSATETIGDTTAIVKMGMDRDITSDEVRGSLMVDGLGSTFSAIFGCTPVTSFSQNVGIVATTKVVNRFTIMTGALALILASFFPPIGAFFNSLPHAVIGGCTVMVFGSIIFSGIRMLAECGFSNRNMTIASLAFCLGVGISEVDSSVFSFISQLFSAFLSEEAATSLQGLIASIFSSPVVGVFLIAIFLNLILPKEKEENKRKADDATEVA